MWGVIQHVRYDGRGGLGRAFARAGLTATDYRAFIGESLPPVSALSGLIVLGAPKGRADADAPEHLVAERALIADAVDRGLPVLGVCFGAQLLAVALGGGLIVDGPPQIGMGHATLTDAGRADPLLVSSAQTVPVLHWHRDSYTLPPGAVRLAVDDDHGEQAFRWRDNVYGMQFHIEIDDQLAHVIADQMPAGSLPPEHVREAQSWGAGVLDRFLMAARTAATTAA